LKKFLRIILPLLILLIGAGAAVLLIKTRKVARPEPRAENLPLVRVVVAEQVDYQVVVPSQGTVLPATDIHLVAEVGGRIVEASPAFTAGGAFKKGDLLLSIDPRDFELALTRARAELTRAEVALQREQAESAVARKEWEKLGNGNAPALVLREPQLADARAAAEAARAVVEQAQRDLERAKITAPFNGRVWEKTVDAGQYVPKGATLGRIYSTDAAEIRLPIRLDQLGFLEGLAPGGETAGKQHTTALIRGNVAGKDCQWKASIVRTEAQVDPKSRMVHAVARVEQPHAALMHKSEYPLAVGMFVEADVMGRVAKGVFALPRSALRAENKVLVVTPDNRLTFRGVREIHSDEHQVIVEGGIQPGERVCISPLDMVVEGMRVRVEQQARTASTQAKGAP